MPQMSSRDQTVRVAYLGATYMVTLTAFNSLQNIISKLYIEYGYGNLGIISLVLVYLVYGLFTFASSYIIITLGYKKSMWFASLGFAIYQAAGFIISWDGLPVSVGRAVVIFGAVLCGASAATIQVAQGSYISAIASSERRTQLFALFYGLMMGSQVFSGMLTTFVLGLVGNTVYSTTLTVLGFGSSFLFLMIPDVQRIHGQDVSISKQSEKIMKIIKNQKYRCLLLYIIFPGVTVGFYATFLYRLVELSCGQSDQLNQFIGFVFLALGFSQILTGVLINRFGERFCKFKMAVGGTILVQLAVFASFLCYHFESYPLCFLVSILWGASDIYMETNIGALMSTIFPGQVEAFSVFYVFFALGVVSTVLVNLFLGDAPLWIFLTIVMILQVCYVNITIKIADLKGKEYEIDFSIKGELLPKVQSMDKGGERKSIQMKEIEPMKKIYSMK